MPPNDKTRKDAIEKSPFSAENMPWESETIYRRVVEYSHDGILFIDDNFRIVHANDEMSIILGRPAKDIVGKPFMRFLDESSQAIVTERYRKRQLGKEVPHRYEIVIVRRDGERRTAELSSTVVQGADGKKYTVAQLLDITERKTTEAALIESEEKYRSILESIEDGYFEVDLAGNITFFNDAFCSIFLSSPERLTGLSYKKVMDEENAHNVMEAFNYVYRTRKPIKTFDWQLIRGDKTTCFVEASISPIIAADSNIVGFRGIIRDVSERKEYEKLLAFQASHDELTGLFNRKAFVERLEESILHAKRYGCSRAVLFVDLDEFKSVNDRFGHEIGDLTLVEAARRIKDSVRETDYVCRLGGDEFTIILNNPSETKPKIVLNRIHKNLKKPFLINGNRIDFLSASIGVSLFPKDGEDVESLIRRSDQEMYKSKRNRKTSRF